MIFFLISEIFTPLEAMNEYMRLHHAVNLIHYSQNIFKTQ